MEADFGSDWSLADYHHGKTKEPEADAISNYEGSEWEGDEGDGSWEGDDEYHEQLEFNPVCVDHDVARLFPVALKNTGAVIQAKPRPPMPAEALVRAAKKVESRVCVSI